MHTPNLIIRPAQPTDANLIAQAVSMGIGHQETLQQYCGANYLQVLAQLAAMPGTLYSYQNAWVAQYDGTPSGAIIGYDGAQFELLRQATCQFICQQTGNMPATCGETEPGEFYIDTLAVLPTFRHAGIGRKLITALCQQAAQMGHARVGLLVDPENTKAQALYASVGFKNIGDKPFFDLPMYHFQFATHK